MRTVPNLILGAGPTGLGAAWRLQELGVRGFELFEAETHAGGLATSFRDERGFTWDIGGHVQFSHYAEFDRVMDAVLAPSEWLTHERESWVWIAGRFVPYPFQMNIGRLPEALRDRCVEGLEKLHHEPFAGRPAHFDEWILATFGEGLAEVFMRPYNFKVWAHPLSTMGFEWIGERVAVTNLERVKENIRLGRDDLSWGPNAVFRFPLEGGTGAIWERVARRITQGPIRYGHAVREIDPVARTVVCANGETVRYERLLSTLPLDQLARICRSGLSEEAREAARRFVFSSSNIVGVGIGGQMPESLRKKCWMYFPEGDCPFYRVTVFSHYSPRNVPDPSTQWSLMAEVSESPHKPVDSGRLVDDVIEGLRRTKLIGPEHPILSTWSYRAEHGYPTPFLGRDALLERILPELEAHGISSRGRFGGWKYEVSNQDHSFMQGHEWAERVIAGGEEVTFFHPARVNAPRR